MADEEISPEEESHEVLITEPVALETSENELVKSDTGNNTVGNMSEGETDFLEASEDYEVPITESPPVEHSTPTTEHILDHPEENIEMEPEKTISFGVQPVESAKVSQKSRLSAKFHKKEQPRHTERQFLEMIGKHEVRNEELGKKEGALRHRLDVLECSMPAVMVWNIWRMAQGAPVTGLRRIVERQFRHVTEGPVCPRTPSRHYDCRVREIEAERKLAQKRVEEARTLCAEKTANLEEKQKKLDEARRTQEDRKRRLEDLTKELQNLRDSLDKMDASSGDCVAGECGDIQCCERWMKKVTSNTSIKSIDIDYLERIQELAEAELCMKKQIADLEYREDTYMRTLQEADDCWSKLESDSVQTQLEQKQELCQLLAERVCDLEDQLEKMRSRLSKCKGELENYLSIEKIEALIGRDDDMASTYDKATCIKAKLSGKIVGGDGYALTGDAASDARVLQADRSTGRPGDLVGFSDRHLGVTPEDLEYEARKQDELRKYFSMLGSLDELDKDDDYVCPPEFICNDVVTSPTGMEAAELARIEKELEMEAQKGGKGKVLSAKELMLEKEFIDFADGEYDEEYTCEPDFICNDVVTSPTGMDDDELRKYEEAAASAAKIEVGGPEEEDLEAITKYESVAAAKEEILERAEREAGEAVFETEMEVVEEEPVIVEEAISEMEKAVTTFEEGEVSEAISEKGVGPELEEIPESLAGIISEEFDADELSRALEGEFAEAEEAAITEEKERSELEAEMEAIAEEAEVPEAITEELVVAEEKLSEVPEKLEAEMPAMEGVPVPQTELLSWLNTLQPIHEKIAKCDTCVDKAESTKELATRIASYAGVEVDLAIPPRIEEVKEEIEEIEKEPVPEEELLPEEAAKVEEIKVPEEIVEAKEVEEVIEEVKEAEEVVEVARPEVEEEPVAAPIEEEEEKLISEVEEKEEEVVAEVKEEEKELAAEVVEAEEELVAKAEVVEEELVSEVAVAEEEKVAEVEVGEEEVAAEVEVEKEEIAAEVEVEKEELVVEFEEGVEELVTEVEVGEETIEAELEEAEIPVEIEAEIVAEEEEETELMVDLITEEIEEAEEGVAVEFVGEAEEPLEEELILEELPMEIEELEEEILEEELPTLEEREITEEDLLPELPLPEAEEEEEEEVLSEEIPLEEMEEIIEEEEEEEEEEEIEIVKEIPLEGEIPVEIIGEEEEEEVPEEVEPIIEKPEIEILDIEPIEEKMKPEPYLPIKKVVKPSMLIDPQIVSKPYLSVAAVEERDKASVKPMIQKYLAFVNRLCAMQPTVSEEIKIIKSEITKTETVQTELVQSKVSQKLTQTLIATDSQTFAEITIPSCKVKDAPVSKLYEKSQGTDTTSPRRYQCQFQTWPEREQLGVSTADKASQTERSPSKGRISKDTKQFTSVGETAKLGEPSKPDFERELRSISYKKSEDAQGDCVCCACGKPNQGQKRLVAPLPPLIHPIPMQPMKKPAIPFLKDQETCKLCPDCRRRKQKLSDEPKTRRRSPKSPLMCDSTACICASSASKTKILSVLLKKFDKPERKDQGCMAKIPKLKNSSQESRKRTPDRKYSDHRSCCCPGRKEAGKSKDPR